MPVTDFSTYEGLFYPGQFYIFWCLLVPLSVLINIAQYGRVRVHEVGLFIALALHPFLLQYIEPYPVIAWIISTFLIVWIERTLSKWRTYQIWSWAFFKTLAFLTFFIALPSLLTRLLWQHMEDGVGGVMDTLMAGFPCKVIYQARDLLIFGASVMLLLHSFYVYTCYHKNVEVSEVTGSGMGSGRKSKPPVTPASTSQPQAAASTRRIAPRKKKGL